MKLTTGRPWSRGLWGTPVGLVDQNKVIIKFSTKTSCLNNKTSWLAVAKFISEDRMLKNTYLYENKILTKWINASFWVGEESIEFH